MARERKAEARVTTAKALRDLSFGRSERLVRINPVESDLAADDLEGVGAPDTLPDALTP